MEYVGTLTFHAGSVKEQVPIIVFGYGTPHTPSRKDGRSPVITNVLQSH